MIWKLCMFRCFFPFLVITRQMRPACPHLLPGNETRYSNLFLDRTFTFMNQDCSLRLKLRKPEVQLPFQKWTQREYSSCALQPHPSLLLWSVAQLWPTLCNPRTVVHRVPLSMEFSRQEYWSGLPFSIPGHFPDPGIEPASLGSPTQQGDSLPMGHLGSPASNLVMIYLYFPKGHLLSHERESQALLILFFHSQQYLL